jgi:voltage-gated potassium channel
MNRLARWERLTEWPLTGAAVLFLAAYAWPILDTSIPATWLHACERIQDVIWVMFGIDYVIRLGLAERRWRFVWRHLVDLAIVVLPVLRPLRLLRVVMLLNMLNRSAVASLYGRIAIYVVGATTLLIFCASLAILNAERGHQHANITTFGDALWWAITTMTTVGYGDHYPVTAEGRMIAVGLMIGGVALLGVVTASIASWLVNRVREVEETAQAATRRDIDRLAAMLAQLHTLMTDRPADTPIDAKSLHRVDMKRD